MTFDLQPTLHNEVVGIRPLRQDDFELLFEIASDPLLWEQHPNPDRYKREVFMNYFDGAMKSGGALFVFDQKDGATVGCSRFYDLDEDLSQVLIGYTFVGRKYWGKPYNRSLKKLMLDHAFRFVDNVHFHIGATNYRSQMAIGKIGAVKIGEANVAYHGEQSSKNFIYQIEKKNWETRIL